ncbi:DUF368 domain-containing protein [Microbacterium sp. ZXX196]|uniref:DUF368 domain-containing protein n=1 Tax=Microbacterium sp. ZXX196 TaxID=2609291 RepID=UPI0012B9E0C4|nr:DUF368 domain-containing protein [Microbacterium sp. ZXX196]MTE23354.1 DUF368 domain-containing protein [Microbacterium sp. ZXX196]
MTAVVSRSRRLARSPLDALRGFLIGLAELVPGVSGGTVALVTGVYERALASAHAIGRAGKALVFGPDRIRSAKRAAAGIDGWLLVPLLVGMAIAVLFAAGVVEELVSAHPENARGLFFGLVAASLVVPFQLLPRARGGAARRAGDVALVAVPAVVAFFLVGFASNGAIDDPPMWFVFVAAAIAVCALVVPGVSGSFFLLAVGLYSPTLQAVDERALGYIAVFAAGALVGLATVVQVITVLLNRFRRGTLLVMAGLMLGSLRALWPWQGGAGGSDGHGTLLAPTDPLGPVLFAILGAAVVLALIAVEHVALRRAAR